jgi:hypothetical protein
MVKMFVSKETALARKAICETCPAKSGFLCSDCGCIIAAKVRVNTSKCPQGKWSDGEAVLSQPWDVEEILANSPVKEQPPCCGEPNA